MRAVVKYESGRPLLYLSSTRCAFFLLISCLLVMELTHHRFESTRNLKKLLSIIGLVSHASRIAMMNYSVFILEIKQRELFFFA